jgi:hypothetical protein
MSLAFLRVSGKAINCTNIQYLLTSEFCVLLTFSNHFLVLPITVLFYEVAAVSRG